jgi:hypothetical protein
MTLAYTPPGVSISEVVTPQISPLLSASALICLVGITQGYQTRTDQFVLSGTTATPLPNLPDGATVTSVTSVKDALNPSAGASDGSGYVVTTDYTVQAGDGTITRVGAGAISDGTLVNVTYRYVPSNYYDPIRLYDLGSIESRFGSGLNAAGTAINSPVSYAASIAFENGADSVVIQPLLARETPGDATTDAGQPNTSSAATAGSYANASTWADTLYNLRDIEDINVIVPIVGQSQTNVTDAAQLAIFSAVQDHIQFMKGQDQYIVGLFGEDSSASNSVAQKATLQTHANTLRGRYGGALAEHSVFVSPAKFSRSLPGFGQTLTVGGQFAATALAGMLASRGVSSSLTRKVVSGFTNVAESRNLNEKNADAAAGLLVIENKSGNVLVRHAITLDQTSSARRELSVVRAKHRMIESVRDTLDRQIVGHIIADGNASSTVSNTVSAVLEQLRLARDLVDYSPVEARLLSFDPTLIQVRYSYRPAFPLNNVAIEFSVDLSSGSITASDTTLAGV